MIQALSNKNHRNINFKSELPSLNNSAHHCAQQACAYLAQTSQDPSILKNVLALGAQSIEISPVTLSKADINEGRIYLQFKKTNGKNDLTESINLTNTSVAQIQTREDAQALWNDIITKAWTFCMGQSIPHDRLKIN